MIKLNIEVVEKQRQKSGLSRKQLADTLKMTRQGYWDMINRRSVSRIDELADLFEIPKAYLVVIE